MRRSRLIGPLLGLGIALTVAATAMAGLPPPDGTAAIRPNPAEAEADVPVPQLQSCMIGIELTRSGPCLYGDRRVRRRLFLFGDSHALQYFPALQILARRERLRLVVLTKRECPPAAVTVFNELAGGAYTACDAWRREELSRIEADPGHPLVLVGGKADYTAYGRPGEALAGKADAEALQTGYVATLRRLQRAGARVVVIRDIPKAPFNPPECVLDHPAHLRACNFAPRDPWRRNFDIRAAKQAGAALIDPTPKVCPGGLCRAVLDNVLVYRDPAHLTAAFARTLAPWFERTLGKTL